MPPDRGRASRACTSCRKIKTRCYDTDITGKPCLRCDRLGQACSLDTRSVGHNESRREADLNYNNSTSSNDDRLSRLEETVSALVKRLDEADTHKPAQVVSDTSLRPSIGYPLPRTRSTAPVLLLRDVSHEVGVPSQHSTELLQRSSKETLDIIDKGLISIQEAYAMIELFQEHYGRWVAFNAISSQASLLEEVRRSPLLLCSCCLIAIRHTARELAPILTSQLFQEAKSLLASALLQVPQSIEFFQAILILSMWSTTIGQSPLSIDSWLISGIALQHCVATDTFAQITNTAQAASLSKYELDRWCIWNHICLVHLHYCVGTRRKSILDRQQLTKCRKILDFDHATNFESRMVAEVNLYWIIYESCSKATVDLPSTQAALQEWKHEWKFLFDQPRSQFLQMGFKFAELLIFDQALKSRSAAVRESLVLEMIRLSESIIKLALNTTDARTRHLSDHIYHMITFAAVTLCRLLHMYENQVASSQNVIDLDSLILMLVSWLYSIGLPHHVAHTLGAVVAAFHKKLRPNANPSSNAQTEVDIRLYFPDLLDIEMFDDGNFDFLPDWEPQIQ